MSEPAGGIPGAAAAAAPATKAAQAGIEPTRADALREIIGRVLPEGLEPLPSERTEVAYEISADRMSGLATTLRDHPELRFEMCMDVCGIDYLEHGRGEWKTINATQSGYSRGVARGALLAPPTEETGPPRPRFAVIYHLLSISLNHRLRLRVPCVDDSHPMVDSMTGVWASANWFEREAFDLFGILFRGHPDLRRLLTDYGFIGHPFRKDFPLSGNVEVRYDPEKGRVVYQPVTIDPRILVPKVIRHDHRYDPALTRASVSKEPNSGG